jgi:hypothetical protein
MRALLVAMLLAMSACSPPLPEGQEVNVSKAADLVLDSWGYGIRAPGVFIVENDGCAGPNNTGFVSPYPGQGCVGGFTMRKSEGYDETRVYLVRPFDGRLSWDRCFVHELAHWVGKDHPIPGTWTDDSDVGRMVNQGNALLWAHPELDTIEP